MPRTLQKVFGRWWWVVVVYSEFSVLLWSKALVLDLDQAEQQNKLGLSCAKLKASLDLSGLE